jgi:glycerol-3-phosphate dehydrogenase
MIFAIPRGRITYIGTTDTDFKGNKDQVLTNAADADYLLEAVNQAFPAIKLKKTDIISSWAGLRPLINQPNRKTTEISRKDEVFVSKSGLISIAGGKLTGYRKMAQKIVSVVATKLKKKYNTPSLRCRTKKIKLSGNTFNNENDVIHFCQRISDQLTPVGLTSFDAGYLVHNYGQQVNQILELFQTIKEEDPRLRLIKAELLFSIHHEMVLSATDFFIRRTGRLFFDMESVKKYATPVLYEMRIQLLWNLTRLEEEKRKLEAEIYHATCFS